MKCLVTGGAGFIGSNLALELEAEGHEVIVTDNLLTGTKNNLKGFKGKFLNIDISKSFEINEHLDVIFHEAAITDPRFNNDEEMLRANIEGFKNIIQLAKNNNAKLVYASTANLYGNTQTPMKESQEKQIITAYGKSKLEMDNIAEQLKNEMHIVGLRYFNVFGPREQNKGRAASMIYHLSNQMKENKSPRIFKHGEQKRDNIYVKDAVTATIKAIEAKSGIYNVGTGIATDFNQIVKTLNEVLNTNLEPKYFDNPYNKETYQNNTRADTTSAELELKFKAQYDLKQGIKDYMDFLKKEENELSNILNNFKQKNILIIGDIMLDKYIFGNVDRISPEAPVQVVEVKKEDYLPGGAANVANNIAALKANAFIVGIVGNDNEASILLNELKKRNINTEGIIIDNNKPTTQKVRILGQKQQLLRIDYEKRDYLNKETENNMLDFIKKQISNIDAIIISDYAKGVITKDLIKNIKDIASNKIIIVDPKPKHKDFYKNTTLITPNLKEAKEMAENEKDLFKELNTPILITKGEKGMSLIEETETTNIPTKAKEVYDVSGAGDTVVATLALALSSNATLKQAATLANHAAGITVGKVGTSTVNIEEIKRSLENE